MQVTAGPSVPKQKARKEGARSPDLLSASLQELPCVDLALGAGVAIGYRVHSQGWDLRDAGSGKGDLIEEGDVGGLHAEGTLFRPVVHNLGVACMLT